MLRLIVTLCCCVSLTTILAQAPQIPYLSQRPDLPTWVQLLYSGTAEAEQIQQAFDVYYQQHPFEKNQHTQYFKRWKRQLARAPYWQGMNAQEQRHYRDQQCRYWQQHTTNQARNLPAWRALGPFDFDKDAASASYACGAAHVYTVRLAPSNPAVLYAGTATAGIWRSQDNGLHWTLTTRDQNITTVRALAVDPNQANTVYAGSDLDGQLYKTTNGGNTWAIMGDTAFRHRFHTINDISIHPQFGSLVLVASNHGLFRSTNSGASWTPVLTGNVQELERHPYLPAVVYAVRAVGDRTEFYKSTDNGATFVQKTNGWPVPATVLDEQRRTEIAVSPADSNRIYALCAGAVGFGSGLYGIYVSNDAGESWASSCCGAHLPNYLTASNPNLLHWFADGTGNGGQYYYDLALGVSPTNADSVWALICGYRAMAHSPSPALHSGTNRAKRIMCMQTYTMYNLLVRGFGWLVMGGFFILTTMDKVLSRGNTAFKAPTFGDLAQAVKRVRCCWVALFTTALYSKTATFIKTAGSPPTAATTIGGMCIRWSNGASIRTMAKPNFRVIVWFRM